MAWTIPELEMLREPRMQRQLFALRRRIHSVIAPLDARVATSPEPLPFAERTTMKYRRARAGTLWGRAHTCAWFHITADLRGTDPTDLALLLDTDGESILRNDAGEVVGMVTSRLTPIERHAPARAKTRVALTPELLASAAPDGRLSLWLDTGFNGKLVQPFGIARVRRLDLVRVDRELEDAYYDILTVAYASLRAGDLENRYAAALAGAVDAAHARDWAGVRAALAPVLGGPGCAGLALTGLGHAHLDMAWLWPLRETRRKAHRTFRAQFDLLEQHPDHVFGASQPVQFAWIEEDDPELFARMVAAEREGRFEIQGGFWCEPDTNLPSGESLVRQAIHGQRYWESRFGKRVTTCWLPDAFGYSGALPQILRGAGMDSFLTIKLAWNEHNDFPHRSFVWEGIDDTGVLVHMPPEGTYTSTGSGLALGTARDQYPENDIAPIGMILFGTGDGGGGPSEIHLELTRRSAHLLAMPSLTPGTATDFFADLAAYRDDLPHWRGELYLEKHQGTFTTQGAIKAGNRRLEHTLHDLEHLAAEATWAGRATWPAALLDASWKELLLHQFHDMLPGSSIERVHRESREAYARIDSAIAGATEQVLSMAAAPALPIAFVNTTPVRRTGWVEHDRAWWHHDTAPFATTTLRAFDPAADGTDPTDLGHDEHAIWNDRLRVEFAPDGAIRSLVDRATGREHARGALGRLVVHRDPFQMFDAWDIKLDYVRRKRDELEPVATSTFRDGPRIVRRHEYQHGRTAIVQDVVLTLGADTVQFETEVDWQERLRMLRVEFEPEAWSDEVACEIQFGHIMRSTRDDTPQERAQFEICAHRWVDVSDERGFGFSVLNDGKYGHRVKERLISLNLLRSPIYPDRHADRGTHRFSYAVHPHEGSLGPSTTTAARHLNAPVLIARVPESEPVLTVEPESVLVDSVLLDDATGDLVLRVYESAGTPATAWVRFGGAFSGVDPGTVRRTNLLLDDEGPVDPERFPLRPFEIVTLRVPRPTT